MSILKSSLVVSSLTMGSRILGFLRDVVIANKLGVSAASDAFFVALLVPNLLRRIFAEGAFGVVFVPILSRLYGEKKEEGERFAGIVLTWMIFSLAIVVVLGEVFMAEFIRYIVAPGWASSNPEKLGMVVPLAQITFPYLAFITLASMVGGVCNTLKHFGAYAFVPVLLNVSFILCLFILPLFGVEPVMAATWAIPLGGVLQLSYMFYALRKTTFKLLPSTELKHEELGPMFKRLGPAALTVGILQISFLIDVQFASFIADEAVSYLQYANRFYQFPLALIGVTLATVLLPHFSEALGKKDKKSADTAFTQAATYGLALALASTAGLMFLAEALISSLFGHGKFTAENAELTALTMQAYCVGLPALVLTKITITAFYANKDTKTPVIISLVCLGVNIGLNFLLIGPLSYTGLALATGLTAYVNASLQVYFLRKQGFIGLSDKKVFFTNMAKTCGITLVMVAALGAFQWLFPIGEAFGLKMIWITAAGTLGTAVFMSLGHVSGLFDVRQAFTSLRQRKKV